MPNFGIDAAKPDSLLKTSPDYDAMAPYWGKVADIEAGVERLRQPSVRKKYLPPFPAEEADNYSYRASNSVLTDIFGDVCSSLAAKPFTKEAGLYDETPPPQMQAIVEDVTRSGDHLHSFAQAVFFNGIAYGLDWVLVDHTAMPKGATLADELRVGSRPYMVRIPARDMLQVKSAVTAQGEVFTFARVNESYQDDDGNTVERVRLLIRDDLGNDEYGQPRFEVWEKKGDELQLVQEGDMSLDVIPLIAFYTGRREPGTWRFTLPMSRVINLQIEHYQAQTNLKMAKEETCFPVWVAQGIRPPKDGSDRLGIGSSTILYAPMSDDGKYGDWKREEPAATSLEFLSKEADKIENNMRELGRLPLTANSAGITAISAQMSSERSNSAAQSWVFTLKDVLEQCFDWCAEWMGLEYHSEVKIDTDFAISSTDSTEPALLKAMAMPDSGQPPTMSMDTLYNELKRRGIVAPEVMVDGEKEKLIEEAQYRQKLFELYPQAQPATASQSRPDRRTGEPESIPDTGVEGDVA